MTLRSIRDALGLALGSIILLHETLVTDGVRVEVLLVGLACLAGTFALRADER